MRHWFFPLFVFFTYIISAQTSLKEIQIPKGPFEVGYKTELIHDSTRIYSRIFDWSHKTGPRPIPISMWYPADKDSKASTLKVLQYMEVLKAEEEWEHIPNEQLLNWFSYPNTEQNQVHLQEVCRAKHQPEPIDGSFPLIVYAPSLMASSVENFVLCELLASHGYWVVSSPSRGPDNRFFDKDQAKNLEAQARDIAFVTAWAKNLPFIKADQVASIGFSFGGLSQVLAQMQTDTFSALVSLDGTIKYNPKVLRESLYFNLDRIDIPFIHMAQKEIPQQVLDEDGIDASLNTDFEFYDALKYSHAHKLQFHRLTHGYFSSLGVLFQSRDPRQDAPDNEIMLSYQWVLKYVLAFLETYLKADETAAAFLNAAPQQNGLMPTWLDVEKKLPKKKPFDFRSFNELAQKQEYRSLMELYRSLEKTHEELEISEVQLNNLGLQLVFNPAFGEKGIRVLEFAIEVYPKSANLLDSLAEGYLYLDKKELAIDAFKKSLALDANNQNARNRLAELQ
jgi:dienelactone hydrolase